MAPSIQRRQGGCHLKPPSSTGPAWLCCQLLWDSGKQYLILWFQSICIYPMIRCAAFYSSQSPWKPPISFASCHTPLYIDDGDYCNSHIADEETEDTMVKYFPQRTKVRFRTWIQTWGCTQEIHTPHSLWLLLLLHLCLSSVFAGSGKRYDLVSQLDRMICQCNVLCVNGFIFYCTNNVRTILMEV